VLFTSTFSDHLTDPISNFEFTLFLRAIRFKAMLRLELKQAQARVRLLQALACKASGLIQYEMSYYGIPPLPAFVPPDLGKVGTKLTDTPAAPGSDSSDATGPQRAFRLRQEQWLLIEPLLDDLHLLPPSRRGRPRSTPLHNRPLLEAILLKYATGCRWDQLRSHVRLRSCRLLYTRLYFSGRLTAILQLLRRHLNTRGSRTLLQLASDTGSFALRERYIVPVAGRPLDWEERTALLLLQRAYFNYRAILRRWRKDPWGRSLASRHLVR
jgi:hypothetical protein